MHHVHYRRTHSSSWTFHSFDALHLPALVANNFVFRVDCTFSVCAVSLPTRLEFDHILCDSLHSTKSGQESSFRTLDSPSQVVQPWATLSPQIQFARQS